MPSYFSSIAGATSGATTGTARVVATGLISGVCILTGSLFTFNPRGAILSANARKNILRLALDTVEAGEGSDESDGLEEDEFVDTKDNGLIGV